MDDGGLTPLLITLFLVLFADYIAVTETALASVSKVRMKTLAERGSKPAAQVLEALDQFDRTISTLLICTNIAHLASASLITVWVTRRWGLSAVTLSTVAMSLFLFFFAEMLPKSIAKKYSEFFSLRCIGLLRILIFVCSPASALLAAIGNAASHLSKGDPPVSVTEDELYDIIEDMTEEGSLDEEHGDLISSALQFNDVTVEGVLTPRVDLVAIDIDDDPEEILNVVKNTTFSRLPVYEGTIDNVIGILRIRRYLRAFLKEGKNLDIRSLLDEPLFVTMTANVHDLLPLMSKERQSLAIVSDHYGGTAGIVTIEDILEELVGDIWDEDDVVETPFIDLGSGRFVVDAEETVGDTFAEIGFEDPEEDEDMRNKRLGEWVFEHFPAVPGVSDAFGYHGLTVTVARMEHNRIRRVSIKLPAASAEGGEDK